MTDNPNFSYISTLRTPDGGTHYLKDAEARAALTDAERRLTVNEDAIDSLRDAVKGGTHFIGVTTSVLSDGSAVNPVTVEGVSVTAQKGDFTVCNVTKSGVETSIEFIWTGSKWSELGSTGTLKALAFKDEASGVLTPEGTVSAPKLTVSENSKDMANLTAVVDEETETLTLSGTTEKVLTGVGVTAEAPSFTGREAQIHVS